MELKTLRGSITIADVSDGVKGENGKSINWLGEFSTPPTNPQDYDAYYNIKDKKSYLYYEGQWHYFAQDGKDGVDGANGAAYDIVLNKNKIIKYKESVNQINKYNTVISPNELSLYLVNRSDEGEKELLNTDYDISFSFISVPEDGQEFEKCTFFSTLNPSFISPNIMKNFVFKEGERNWIIKLGDLLNISLPAHQSGLNEEVYLAFHNSNTNDNNTFNKNNTLDSFAIGDTIYVGLYYPTFKFNQDTQTYYWEEKPNEFEAYFWYEYGLMTNTIDTIELTLQFKSEALNLHTISNFLLQDEVILFFEIWKYDSESKLYYCVKTSSLPCQWSSAEDLATLAVNAGSIVGAIDNSKLSFSRDGLSITNGGLLITNNVNGINKELLTFDDTGDLVISGKIYATDGIFKGRVEANEGFFRGEVHASSGSFTGDINATSGTFNGIINAKGGNVEELIIGDAKGSHLRLYAIKINEKWDGGIYHQIGENKNDSNFSIDLDGNVIANSINITKGSIGRIQLEDSTIRSDVDAWSITPEKAVFKNVEVSGKITTSVFEKNNVQLCGGTFLFKDGIIIDSIELTADKDYTNGYLLGSLDEVSESNLYMLTNDSRENYIFCSCTAEQEENGVINKTLKFLSTVINGSYNLLINLGTLENGKISDWLIGINSTSQLLSDSGLVPNSITFSEVGQNAENDTYQIVPKVILGQINLPKEGLNSYGLYAESAFLSGTLTTKLDSARAVKYAGVNTLNGATFSPDFTSGLITDNSKIVFWAGSENNTNEAIQKSAFQVTENGTLYTQQAYITGATIVGGTLEATELCTVKLTGKKDDAAALVIQDTDTGIEFRDTNNQVAMSVKTGQMLLSMPLVLTSDDKSMPKIRHIVLSEQGIRISDKTRITLMPDSLNFFSSPINDQASLTDYGYGDYFFKITNDTLQLNYGSKDENNILTTRRIINYKKNEEVNINCNLSLKENLYIGKLENEYYTAMYQPVQENGDSDNQQRLIGIDLYIEEVNIS